MSEENIETIVKKKQEHIALSEISTQKITNWIEQVGIKKKGVKISRKDFVNWLIEKSPENLGSSDLNSLIEKFYDEATFLRQLLREVKTRKDNGESDSGFELVVKTKKSESKKEPQPNEEVEIL